MRPFAEGADGFVMGEGAVVFLLKRLADAERDGDKIYAVLRGIAGSSDGKGKGITAPNPVGQILAIQNAWQNAGLSPATATLMEGHGTSTRVGDVVEVQSMMDVLSGFQLAPGSVALGSVKSNIGHLKGAAGGAGLLKAALALRDKVLPPTVNCTRPNPDIDFAHSPLYVNTELKPWTVPADGTRRAGASAFGFGGTNFHVVLEEHISHHLTGNGKRWISVSSVVPPVSNTCATANAAASASNIANTDSVANTANAANTATTANPANTARTTDTADTNTAEVSLPTAVSASDAQLKTEDAVANERPMNSINKDISCIYSAETSPKIPLRGALVIGAATQAALAERLRSIQSAAEAGRAPIPVAPAEADLRAPERLAIDYTDAADLVEKAAKGLKALAADQPAIWKALRAQGIFRGHGPAPKVAFLYTGQGSQYVNMLRTLRASEPIVAETFAEADRIMTPLLGKPLSEFIFVDSADEPAVAKAEDDLRQTAITQPAVITTDIALTRLLAVYGIEPDMAMGHSVGEYGALVAAGALPFEDSLEAVSARGREMTRLSLGDNGRMAAVFAPLAEIERLLKTIDGYVVIANVNSYTQAVIGGTVKAIDQAIEMFLKAGYNAVPLQVSHAFHTSIVAAASEPLRRMMERLRLQRPTLPIITNVTGKFYSTGPDCVPQMLDLLARQVASPVQFVQGLHTLYEAGARVFVETGPKKALQGFVEDVLGPKGDVVGLFTNHPKVGDIASFNQALCGLYAAGLGRAMPDRVAPSISNTVSKGNGKATHVSESADGDTPMSNPGGCKEPGAELSEDRYLALGRMFAEVLERGRQIVQTSDAPANSTPIAITGAALGLPGTERIFDDSNVSRILRGDQFIDAIPARFRRAMLEKNVTRLVKNDNGGAFEPISSVADVIKLAARGGAFDLVKEFGVSADRLPALDQTTRLAIAAGIDALRDAGIPMVMRYKTTSKGTQLPDRWGLPDGMRDDTGIIFASAYPGCNALVDEVSRYYEDRNRREQMAVLQNLRARATNGHAVLGQDMDRLLEELRGAATEQPYSLDRRFVMKVLSMGHSQFAELIGARGPNTHINAACASTTQGVSLAEDWIRAGRCRRVIVIWRMT